MSVCVGPLRHRSAPRETITCTLADTDYAGATVVPSGTRRLAVAASAVSFVAFGETSAGNGIAVPANDVVYCDLIPQGGDTKVHVQSPTAGAKVYVTYLKV